jgi:dolichol-phosphate mannosyltransferase
MVKVSVILPTYNERENIDKIIWKLGAILSEAGYDYEIIVVDDNSPDGTAHVAEALSKTYPVKVVKRPGRLGLTSAIYDGFKTASGEYLVVMDADFQHPPELVPELLAKLKECDLVVASRYVKGGKIENWSLTREIISKGAILGARLLIPECRRVKDPVSGFFALRREIIEKWKPIEPRGYKALVEIIASTKPRRICEVPFTFRGRERGTSKLGSKQIFSYAKLLVKLGFKYFLVYSIVVIIVLLAIIYFILFS